MKHRLLCLALLVLASPAVASERPLPSAHCLDGRAIVDAHQSDPRTLALRGASGERRRVTLARACPGILDDADLQFVGWNGFLCGGADDAVRTAARTCPIADVAVAEPREYAVLVRTSRETLPTLDRVVVRGQRARGFRGTPDYCVANRWIRSWHEDPDGLMVEVSPRRAAGHRYYRIETAGHCTGQVNADTLSLVSGVGTGVICGHAGDHIVFSKSTAPGPVAPDTFMRSLAQTSKAGMSRCRVSSVYPVER
jgi:hypothetical protein